MMAQLSIKRVWPTAGEENEYVSLRFWGEDAARNVEDVYL